MILARKPNSLTTMRAPQCAHHNVERLDDASVDASRCTAPDFRALAAEYANASDAIAMGATPLDVVHELLDTHAYKLHIVFGFRLRLRLREVPRREDTRRLLWAKAQASNS